MPVPQSDSVEPSPRRSILRNIHNLNVSLSNDDDAERRDRRRTLGKSNQNESISDTMIGEQEELKNCLKIFHDNKISKENAWSLTLIDNMARLCNTHHKSLRNFQIIGSSLEATSKIYGLRVDSVHSDVLRMTSGLGRFKASDLEDHGDEQRDQNDQNANQNGELDADGQPKQIEKKKKRTRKQLSTVTKNKDTLNAKLDTIPLPDPLFSKLNSIMGDVSSANRLLLNVLQTKQSDLKLTMDECFWDNTQKEPNEYNDTNEYEWTNEQYIELPMIFNVQQKHRLRQQLSGYSITNTPIDDDEEEAPIATHNSFNQSQIDYAFDIHGECEQVNEDDGYAIEYEMDCDEAAGGNEMADLTADDRTAINACKGLRRPKTIIEDLRPADTKKLEYSYRPLDNINQFWAGPSYWKFRKSRNASISKESTFGSDASKTAAQPQKRRPQKKKVDVIPKIELYDPNNDDGVFISVHSKGAQKLSKGNWQKRWDPKKLKLPTDLRIDRTLFDHYEFCPSLRVRNDEPKITTDIAAGGYNYDNADDREYCNRVQEVDEMDRDTDHEIDTEIHLPEENEVPHEDAPLDSQNDKTLAEIGQTYEGAPEMIEKIQINFAKRAKVIDMKQLKSCCLQSVQKQQEKTATRTFSFPQPKNAPMEEYNQGAASFGVIYNTLPRLLTKTMTENLSPSVAFYSVLHLANENRLRLHNAGKLDEANIFFIRSIK